MDIEKMVKELDIRMKNLEKIILTFQDVSTDRFNVNESTIYGIDGKTVEMQTAIDDNSYGLFDIAEITSELDARVSALEG